MWNYGSRGANEIKEKRRGENGGVAIFTRGSHRRAIKISPATRDMDEMDVVDTYGRTKKALIPNSETIPAYASTRFE